MSIKKTTTRKRRVINLTDEQKAKSAERRDSLTKLAKSVRAIDGAKLEIEANKLGLLPSVAGHLLSPFNTIFVNRQRPTATKVGGFQQWKKEGRKVKKGCKAIAIWLPFKKENKQTKEEETGFRLVNVFDIADTEAI